MNNNDNKATANKFLQGQTWAVNKLKNGMTLMEGISELKKLNDSPFRDGVRSILANDNGVYGRIALGQTIKEVH